MAQKTQTGDMYQPGGMEWGGRWVQEEGEFMYTYD